MSVIEKNLKINMDVIKRIAKANTVKNEKGLTVVTKDDPIREETDFNSSIKSYEKNK